MKWYRRLGRKRGQAFGLMLSIVLGLASLGSAVTHARLFGAQVTVLCADGMMRDALIAADGEEIGLHHDCLDCLLQATESAAARAAFSAPQARRAVFKLGAAQPRGRILRPKGARDPPKV